ncbi:hypothetical protein PC9H_002498 [Pleurotus ostreatus]|uniref:Uncharacterized protein n=1 Tax=Pleurotus ostreatus TaxID=5322 RepID=A0A8H7DPJ1_PLEOS|nr:uncharacterized protein PC9H_002498 [Pleurotus ostreatus]KAF7416233.1 hypothetical protein PC9H_002498 [Pleurotus ostreatus]
MSRSSDHTLVESFRDSTHLIPSRAIDTKKPSPYDPLIMKIWVCVATAASMMGVGIALEIGLAISARNGGFSVPQQNVVSFVSPQFLLSFFPTLFVLPVAFLWREIDWMVRWYEPYVVLSRGHATAEESLLLDFFFSALTAATTYIFQPLAGAIFQLRQIDRSEDWSVTSSRAIGLAPDVSQLNGFLAAAGYAEAAVAHNLSDPPFVKNGWATAEFVFPQYPGLNGTLAVNTTGIQTDTACRTPRASDLVPQPENLFNYTATSVDGCIGSASFNASDSNTQYGVVPVSCAGASPNITFQPVMFWYFHLRTDNNLPEAKAVFCTPAIKASNVEASVDLEKKTMSACVQKGDLSKPNNVTGPPLNGRAYNGLIFNFSPDEQDARNNPDRFVAARATAVAAGVSGAIFRLASQQSGGLQATFDLPNGFLDLTTQVYTQHLAITAKSVYFLPDGSQLNGRLTSSVPRLWIDPLPGHALAILIFMVGFVGVVIHILGRRARRNLILCAPPGSIAAVMALTSRSGFGELLLPYDDEKTLEKKLSGLTYKMDRRTGAIVADEKGFYEFGGGSMGRDDAMMSLMGQTHDRVSGKDEGSYSDSSSHLAHQLAAGYPPWVARGA